MNAEFVIRIAGQAIDVLLKTSAPIMLVALAIGLIVSIFQATTQIQEQTLAFVPKILAVLIGLMVFGPWMLTSITDFAAQILGHLTDYIG